MVKQLQLDQIINQNVHVFKIHNPYYESDHVLNIAYNILCQGDCLEDIERLRNDEAYLDALGAVRIPDPTTAGDFCRRFDTAQIKHLQDAINQVRIKVWKQQDPMFLKQATIVLAANPALLQSVHGNNLNVTGPYQGKLSNSGEELILKLPKPHDLAIMRFEYDDNWNPTTDGQEQSLGLLNPLDHPYLMNNHPVGLPSIHHSVHDEEVRRHNPTEIISLHTACSLSTLRRAV